MSTEELRSVFIGPQPDQENKPHVGDYVVATEWESGLLTECVGIGFVESEIIASAERAHKRWFLMDQNGKPFKRNGFRRAEKITEEEGFYLISILPEIGNQVGPSIWFHLERFREYKRQLQAYKMMAERYSAVFDVDWFDYKI